MKIFCPCCHGLVGFLAGKADADKHYPAQGGGGQCPFCFGPTAAPTTMQAAYDKAQENKTAWVDEDGDPVTAEVEGPPGP